MQRNMRMGEMGYLQFFVGKGNVFRAPIFVCAVYAAHFPRTGQWTSTRVHRVHGTQEEKGRGTGERGKDSQALSLYPFSSFSPAYPLRGNYCVIQYRIQTPIHPHRHSTHNKKQQSQKCYKELIRSRSRSLLGASARGPGGSGDTGFEVLDFRTSGHV